MLTYFRPQNSHFFVCSCTFLSSSLISFYFGFFCLLHPAYIGNTQNNKKTTTKRERSILSGEKKFHFMTSLVSTWWKLQRKYKNCTHKKKGRQMFVLLIFTCFLISSLILGNKPLAKVWDSPLRARESKDYMLITQRDELLSFFHHRPM